MLPVKRNLDEIKAIFLTVIDKTYAELSSDDDVTQSEISINDIISSFFSKNAEDIRLDELNWYKQNMKFDADDYGELFIGKAKNFFTGNAGFERLINFFKETKDSKTHDEFFKTVVEYYKVSGDNFKKTLVLATAQAIEIQLHSGVNEKYKKLNSIIEQLYPDKYQDEAMSYIGEDILKEADNCFYAIEETLQQQLFRANPKVYFGDKKKQQACDFAREEQVSAIEYLTWRHP